MADKRKHKTIHTTGGTGYMPNTPDVEQLLVEELKNHPDRTLDILYRIISLGNSKEGTKYDRNFLDILKGVYDSFTNKPMDEDRYTGSWTWIRDGLKSNPNRDWNLLFAKGNIKGLYQEIPSNELRGIGQDQKYPNYYGNFVPKKYYTITDNYAPLLEYLADRNLGAQNYEESEEGSGKSSGVVRLPFSDEEYLEAINNKYTVDNVGRFNVSMGKDPAGNPEVLFYDFGNFGREYGGSYGGKLAGLQGELLDTFGNPFNLRQYVPINVIPQEQFNTLPEDLKWQILDMNGTLLDIARANNVPVMQYSPSTDTYETVILPETVITPNKYSNGGELDKPLEWNDLSMKDRAAYIRMGVANGYKDIDSIKEVYNEFREGGNLYHKGGKKQYVYDVLPSLLKKAGVDVRVTSGYRPNGAVGTAKFSHHSTNNAVDIVPTGKSTWADIRNALYNDPEIKSYMLANGYGLLDETGSTIRKKTGATGAHFHIGKDSKPALAYRNRVGALLQTGDNKVVYFTNPFMPIPEDNPKVVASTNIPPLATPTIANILLPVEKLDNIAAQLTLPEVVVTPDEPRNRFFSFTPQDLMNQMQATITPYEPIVLPKPTTASERLAQNSQETASFLLKDLEDSILRNTLLGNYDLDKLRRDLKDLLFYRSMNNIGAYGGNLYPLGGIAPIMNAPAALKKAWNATKKRLYRTVTPEGYHIPKATMEFIKGDTRDYSAVNPADNEVWAKYLLVPYDKETNFEPAIYRPTMGTATYDDVIKLKDESLILSNDILRLMLNHLKQTGKNTMLIEGNERGLGTYTISLGEDENGKYISYYDDWDLNPFRGISAALNVPALSKYGDIVPGSHPFTVYGRRYYTDDDLQKALGGPLVDRTLNIYDGTTEDSQQMNTPVYEPDWSDKLEPYAAGLGLAGDAAGIGASVTGVGIPVGAAIAGVANIPNFIIDGYQAIRDGIRAYNDHGESLGSALWNTGELVLDATGLKILNSINKAKNAEVAAQKLITGLERRSASPYKRVGTGAGRSMARKAAKHKSKYNAGRDRALEESNEYLAKRGVRPSDGSYYEEKLIEEMAKRGYGVSANDAIKSVERTLRQNLGGISAIDAVQNTYHITKALGGNLFDGTSQPTQKMNIVPSWNK